MNLALNARDAMPQGGRLTIETGNLLLDETNARQHAGIEPGRFVVLAVRDTGHGMSADTLRHIFEPFFTTKAPGKGTGLGLATVHGIVKQSGGHIGVQSEPGQGTTFKIYLPRADAPEEEAPSAPAATDLPRGSETVLLVEDEASVRELVRECLAALGYTVLEAGGGAAALELSQAHGAPIHLLVTDMVMPEMGGRELAERLQASRPEARVLYISGYMDVDHEALTEGMAFLQKPFTIDRLSRKVREALDVTRRPGPRPARPPRG
jgi:CheY-like chemotaxis protein